MIHKLEEIADLANANRTKRFLRNPLKYFKGMYFTRLVYPISKKRKVVKVHTFFNNEMSIALPAGLDIYLLGAKTHDSEIRLAKFLINSVKPGDTFLDIGAHFGYYSLLASELVQQNGRVVSIEASKEIYVVLKENIEQKKNTEAHHLACAQTNGQIDFYEFPLPFSEYNTLQPEQFEQFKWIRNNKPNKITVEAQSLSSLCSSLNLIPSFIKIDAEGAELYIINGGKEVLAKTNPMVAMEFLTKENTLDKYQKAFLKMEEMGYKGHVITKDGLLESITLENILPFMNKLGIDSDNIVFVKSTT